MEVKVVENAIYFEFAIELNRFPNEYEYLFQGLVLDLIRKSTFYKVQWLASV